jgi:glycosyltransferase involved in cell wall biosynthesis
VKLAIVVQRYGADINGGAELHARYVAERLARHAEVQVFTTCARDYITWKNELPAGEETVNGIKVLRFPVNSPRNPDDFGRRSVTVFEKTHSLSDELGWLDSEGPTSKALVRHIGRVQGDFDFFVFFSARYYHSWHGVRAVASKSVLVPTAEREPSIGAAIFGPIFRGVRAIMYNSLEERTMIQAIANNRQVPGVVVGVGSNIPDRVQPWRAKRKFNLKRPYALYIGRIDSNKGCAELFDYFSRYATMHPDGLDLVLAGSAVMPIPKHPRIKHLGFVSDEDKFDALGGADLLVMPSPYESLSMVALEAWALGRPVLANGHCDVLRGQAMRSNAGLYYENFEEFAETMYALEAAGPLNQTLGRNGREFFKRHYAWPVIERKYLEMFERLKKEPAQTSIEPLPGWFARRKKNVPPAAGVVDAAPKGPVLR